MHEGGRNCLKYLKRGQNRKEGKGHKDCKKGGKLGEGVGVLKGRPGTPLRTMNCERVHLLKLLAISLKASNFTKNELHRYSSRSLARFKLLLILFKNSKNS